MRVIPAAVRFEALYIPLKSMRAVFKKNGYDL